MNRSYIRSAGREDADRERELEPKEFYNPLFTRSKETLDQIKRKVVHKRKASEDSSSIESRRTSWFNDYDEYGKKLYLFDIHLY